MVYPTWGNRVNNLKSANLASKSHLKLVMQEAAKEYGVSYNLLSKFAWIESKFNHLAQNKVTSSRGLFQITKPTEKRLRQQCKVVPEGSIFNPRTNAYLAACLVKKNEIYLKRKLKRYPKWSEQYNAHFFGAYTAVKFLKSNVEQLGVVLFPKEAKYNRSIFFKQGKPRTIGEIKDLFVKKVIKAKVL